MKATVGSFQPKTNGTRMRCPLDEIGRNSVSPCTMPRTSAWKIFTAARLSIADTRAGQRSSAGTTPLDGNRRNDRQQQRPQALVVAREHLNDLVDRDRRNALDP